MSQFDDLAADLCAEPLAEFFGERAYYTPQGGTTIELEDAIVDRELLSPQGGDASMLDYEIIVRVRRSKVPTVVKGGDTIRLARRKGDTTLTRFQVSQLLGQDGGFWTLGLN